MIYARNIKYVIRNAATESRIESLDLAAVPGIRRSLSAVGIKVNDKSLRRCREIAAPSLARSKTPSVS